MTTIRRLSEFTGVEITDVDVRGLDDAGFRPIYEAWLEGGVAVVRDQELEIVDFLHYSRRFGHVVHHPSKSTRHPEHPDLTVLGIDKFNADGTLNEAIYKRGAAGWHTDGAYDEEPFKATQLYALAVPSRGGDTHFASMYRAYEVLPARLKSLLAGRRGAFTYGGRSKGSDALLDPADRDHAPALHPLLRTHEESGRTSLYFDPGKINFIEGLSPAENTAVIEELTALMVPDEARYDHAWCKGDVVIWDNRCMVHRAAGNYPPAEDRIHWRTSIKSRDTGARVAAE